MEEPSRPGERWPAAALALVAGPAAALLHETETLSVGPPATLWPIAFVVAAAAAGLATGLGLGARGSRRLGAVVALPNLLVVAPYGFLLLFFGLGGSR